MIILFINFSSILKRSNYVRHSNRFILHLENQRPFLLPIFVKGFEFTKQIDLCFLLLIFLQMLALSFHYLGQFIFDQVSLRNLINLGMTLL